MFFGGRYDRQRTLVIRIAAITLASDSAITIRGFRPSKVTAENNRLLESAQACALAIIQCSWSYNAAVKNRCVQFDRVNEAQTLGAQN